MGQGIGRDGRAVILRGQLRERHSLDVVDPHGVDGDVDSPRGSNHRVDVSADRVLVERIDLC
jgi:hypothetical protein